MWSQKILNVAMRGTAMNAPGTPQIHHQNTSPHEDSNRIQRESPAENGEATPVATE